MSIQEPVRDFCFYVQVFLEEPNEADAFLVDEVRPLLSRFLEPGSGFQRAFFIRYTEPRYHLRLRFFGSRAAVWGAPRRQLWAGLRQSLARYPQATLALARYRPEWRRYGGRAGLPLAESVFMASSRAVLDFLALRRRGSRLSKVEFTLASGESLLESLGLTPPQQRVFWERYGGAPSSDPQARRTFEEYRHKLEPLLRNLLADPQRYWASQEPTYRTLVERLSRDLRAARELWRRRGPEAAVPLSQLAHSYLHMHVNRIGLWRSEEDLLKRVRSQALAAPGGKFHEMHLSR